MTDRFSQREGFLREPPITVREGAPEGLREAAINAAYRAGLSASDLRSDLCELLRVRPDPNNWSAGNVALEVEGLIHACDWYRVYDAVEEIHATLNARSHRSDAFKPQLYEDEVNAALRDLGIGWKLVSGRFETRGSPVFEATLRAARDHLNARGKPTSANEMEEALRDLSRRPTPDSTGAIQHGLAALECSLRELAGDQQPTLGSLLKQYREALKIPRPLDQAIEKAWGYASEFGRHLQEGREPTRAEAELVVSMCAALTTYLLEIHRAE